MTQKLMQHYFAAVIISALLITSACKHDPEIVNNTVDPTDTAQNPTSSCDPDTVYFAQQILPLLQSGCAMSGCHNAASHEEGILLDSYAGIISTAGLNISNPTQSEIYRKMVDDEVDERMPPPPYPSFTSEQLALVAKWIGQGAKNNSCIDSECDTTNVTYLTHIKPLIQNHCQGCHSGGNPSGGISLTIYNDVKAVADNGKLFGSISHLSGYSPMPQNGSKLSDCQINAVKIWINQGAPNN